MEIEEIRKEIDKLNDDILEILNKRLELSADVAEYKIKHRLPVYNREREEEIIKALGVKAGDKAKYIIPVFDAILDTSKRLQEDMITEKEGK
ncbi:MAG: chorismate mutase [Lachnospiraceae bacterium]|nr:chorismate mutase [Lachnospiraceae bacterium]